MNRDQLAESRHQALIGEAVDALRGESGAFLARGVREGLLAYLEERRETGSFLRAVLENDWNEAISRAHPTQWNLSNLKLLQSLIYTFFPSAAWGCKDAVATWLEAGKEPDPFEAKQTPSRVALIHYRDARGVFQTHRMLCSDQDTSETIWADFSRKRSAVTLENIQFTEEP